MRHIRFAGRWGAPLLVLLAACVSAAHGAEFEVRTLQEPPRAVILATGMIHKGDLARFQTALRKAQRLKLKPPPLLVLDSLGGSLLDGIGIGRRVKREGIPTAVMPAAVCASACSLIFFGGFDAVANQPDRTVYGSARIGVHHWHRTMKLHGWEVPMAATARQIDETDRQLEAFYDEMHISKEIRRRTEQTGAAQIYLLSAADMSGSEIKRQPQPDADLLKTAATSPKLACSLPCLLRMNVPHARIAWPQSALAAAGADDGDRPLSGETYLKIWPSLFGRQVRIADCTLWLPGATGTPCVVRTSEGRIGFVSIAHTLWGLRGASWLWTRCMTPQPVDACRVDIAGTTRMTPQGPVLVNVTVRPAKAGRSTLASQQNSSTAGTH